MQLTIIVIMMVREFGLKSIGGKKEVVATDYSVGHCIPFAAAPVLTYLLLVYVFATDGAGICGVGTAGRCALSR